MIESFNDIVTRLFPRTLTQVCRDRNSSLYGCFDRNFWHYKIRDSPSIILQQGAYLAYQFSLLDSYNEHEQELKEIAIGGSEFWNGRAKKKSAFEEYYPWEKGVPPLAFSSLAISKLVVEGIVDVKLVQAGLEIARNQLINRFEKKASSCRPRCTCSY